MTDQTKMREPLRRFSPEDGCPERDCVHWQNCVAAMPERAAHPPPFFPDYELLQNSGPDQVGGTGGAKSGRAEILCYSYEPKRESADVPDSGGDEGETRTDVDEWKRKVEAERKEKDAFFSSHPQSPLSLRDRRVFGGLAYWPPDPEFHYEVELHEHEVKQVLKVLDTSKKTRSLWRWGEFHFLLGDRESVLQAYKNDPRADDFFVPFRDATSGSESYGAGRYLDLKAEAHHTEDGKWVLDLNAAYNPWCAYSENYACPFVPPENWLKAPVRAGEKSYPFGKK